MATPGPDVHCYQFFAGVERFAGLADAEPGTFYLTDFLAQHFGRLVIRALGIDAHPELKDAYFGNYRRVVYLSQVADDQFVAAAADAVNISGLDFERVHCGYGRLETGLKTMMAKARDGQADSHLLA